MTILTEPPSSRLPEKPPSPGKLAAVLMSIGITLGTGFGIGLLRSLGPGSAQFDSTAAIVTRADYERVQPGMTQVQVEAILDPGVEVSRSEELTRMIWQNSDGSKIVAEFKHGKLIKKEQVDLK